MLNGTWSVAQSFRLCQFRCSMKCFEQFITHTTFLIGIQTLYFICTAFCWIPDFGWAHKREISTNCRNDDDGGGGGSDNTWIFIWIVFVPSEYYWLRVESKRIAYATFSDKMNNKKKDTYILNWRLNIWTAHYAKSHIQTTKYEMALLNHAICNLEAFVFGFRI